MSMATRMTRERSGDRCGLVIADAHPIAVGSIAIMKKRGPELTPPYHAHHFAYTGINTTTDSQSRCSTRVNSSRRRDGPSQESGKKKTRPRPKENKMASRPDHSGQLNPTISPHG